MNASAIDVNRVRADTPGASDVRHLNNTGCALPPNIVTGSMVTHLALEARIGDHEAHDEARTTRHHRRRCVRIDVFESMLDERVKLVCLTHVPMTSSAGNSAADVGRVTKTVDAIFLLDSCQAAGQLPLDVHELPGFTDGDRPQMFARSSSLANGPSLVRLVSQQLFVTPSTWESNRLRLGCYSWQPHCVSSRFTSQRRGPTHSGTT
jgi:hypothetical protein